MSPEKFVAGTKAEAPEGDRGDSRNKTKGKHQSEGKEKFFITQKPKETEKQRETQEACH